MVECPQLRIWTVWHGTVPVGSDMLDHLSTNRKVSVVLNPSIEMRANPVRFCTLYSTVYVRCTVHLILTLGLPLMEFRLYDREPVAY